MKKFKSKAFWVGHCAGVGIILHHKKIEFDKFRIATNGPFYYSYYPESVNLFGLKLIPGNQKKFRLVEF